MRPTSLVLAPTSSANRGADPTDPEAIVRVLFEKSPLLIYITDLDYKIVLFNRALRDATGYDTSDCRTVPDLLERFYPDPEYRKIVHGIHQGWVHNEHIRDAELVCTLKDATQRTISWSTSRLRVGRGPTIGYIALGVDVTTRRNLQQWVSLFQRSLQYLEEGVVLTDPAGSILAWSTGAERLLGYSEQDMSGRHLEELYLRGERKLIARTVDRALEAEGCYSGEVELERKEGGSAILVFNQFRLDGDTGPALARLTLLTEPSASDDLATRLEEADERGTQQRADIEAARALLDERERRISDLERVVDGVGRQAAESGTRISELEQMLGALESAAAQTVEAGERAADGAAVQLAIAEGEAADARDELLLIQARLREMEEEGAEATARLTQATERAALAEQQAHDSEAALDSARAAADEARADAEAAAARRLEAFAQAEAAQTALLTATTETKAVRTEAETAQALAQAAQGEADAARADAEAARADADASRTATEAAREELATARTEVEAATTELATARAEVEAVTAELAAAQAESAARAGATQELLAAAQASLVAAEEDAAQAAGQVTLLNSMLEKADGTISELEAKLMGIEPPTMAPGEAELAAARERIVKLEKDLEEALADGSAALDEATEAWVQERSNLEEAQRSAVAEAQARAAEERQALEAQLSRDILAAEERAEAERTKVLERHDQERTEWEDGVEIARAEVESRLRFELETLKGRLDSAGDLQPHLVPLESLAFAAADTEGRVIGWSGGAALLDGRASSEALGAILHRDVLRLDKVDWKSLFAQVVVTGYHERNVTLVDRTGSRHDVRLRARLVKGERGQPVGVTEILERPALGASLSVHAQAATARMAFPLHRAIETRAIAGLRSHQGAAAAVKDLLIVGRSVHDATDWADVEGAARRVDLGDLLGVTEDLISRAEDTWRELRATAQDLLWLEGVANGDEGGRHRWNELVTRCLHAVEDGSGKRAKRSFGNQAFVIGRGDALVPLLLALLSPTADADGEATVTVGVEDGDALLKVEGAVPAGDDATLVQLLAAEANGTVQITGGKSPTASLRVPLEAPDEPIAADENDEDDRTSPPTRPMKAITLDPEETRPPAGHVEMDDADPATDDEVDLGELELEELGDSDIDDASAADEPAPTAEAAGDGAPEEDDKRPRRGRVDLLEEQDDGGLVVMAGEDSVVVHGDEIRAAVEADVALADSTGGSPSAASGELPEIDELERLFDEAVKVSPSILATADEMDAYASDGTAEQSSDGLDGAGAAASNRAVPAIEAKTDAGRRVPSPPDPLPTAAAMKEMASTDTGERMGEDPEASAPPEDDATPQKKTSRKRKKSSRRSRRGS